MTQGPIPWYSTHGELTGWEPGLPAKELGGKTLGIVPSALRMAKEKEKEKEALSETEEESAEASLKEERAAIASYQRRRRGTHGPLRAAFDHAIPEERDHARMFEKALKEEE